MKNKYDFILKLSLIEYILLIMIIIEIFVLAVVTSISAVKELQDLSSGFILFVMLGILIINILVFGVSFIFMILTGISYKKIYKYHKMNDDKSSTKYAILFMIFVFLISIVSVIYSLIFPFTEYVLPIPLREETILLYIILCILPVTELFLLIFNTVGICTKQ